MVVVIEEIGGEVTLGVIDADGTGDVLLVSLTGADIGTDAVTLPFECFFR